VTALYSLIKLRKSRFKTFKIDALLAEHGHSVLRLPPYHPDLNPIELLWESNKEYVARKNVSFRLYQRFLTCGPRTSGGPRLFGKLNIFSQQINKVFLRKKAKSEIENLKTLCKSEGI
jgi:hypothetical protein